MNKTLTGIGNKVGEENLSQSCSGDGCRVYMTDVPSPRVIVDMEGVFKSRPDYAQSSAKWFLSARHSRESGNPGTFD